MPALAIGFNDHPLGEWQAVISGLSSADVIRVCYGYQ
jgi:hypothetical protein